MDRLALLALLCSLVPLPITAQEASPPLNVVFFLVDDLGWRDLGCYGSSFYETPHIDRLAREGMRFTNAYAAAPVCSPTRASILAGKYPARMGTTDYFGGRRKGKLLPAVYVDRLPEEEVTLAEALHEAGYRTGFFGKWHLGAAPHTPESQGFDVNRGGFARGHPPGGYFSPYRNPKLEDGPEGEYLTRRLTEEALKFLDEVQEDPFLLYFSFYNVHTPLQAQKEVVAKYERKRAAMKTSGGARWAPEGERKCRQVQDHAVYAAMVEAVDEAVGSVLERLEDLGIADRTAVFLMSDNGGLSTSEGHPTSNLPLRAGKGWLYEGGIREPMIVHWPGEVTPGSTCDTPVTSTDFYPTILEMTGLPPRPEQHVDGASFVSLLRGAPAAPGRALFWHYPHYGNQGGSPGGAIRVDDLKLVECFEDDRVELYDLARDLGEQKDLSAARPAETRALRERLHAWRRDVGARMPRPNPEWKDRGRRKQARRPNLLAIPEVPRDEVICFALYTVHERVLKMTAQLYPLKEGEERQLRLEVEGDNSWKQVATAPVIEAGWTATFRVEDWDDTRAWHYRVVHDTTAFYEGRIRKNPVDQDEIVVAAFTGNSVHPAHGGDISRQDILGNVEAIDADLLFFSGDQVYDHTRHYAAWLKFGRDFGPIIRNRPTITIPDDHDVGQSNLWGAGGKKSKSPHGPDGGYFRPVEYVKMVERAQTSHLPDPFDPTPVERGIGVYYTSLRWGRISFAILEDRKFKSGPQGLIPQQGPRPDHIVDPDYDPRSIDVPKAVLLGERQLHFLDVWARDWRGADMKIALSQTIFCGGAHIHGKVGGRLHADLDSNGWPQTGRNKAIAALRKGFALHLAGDQHLATIFQHGVDDWRDGIFSFCVPSIANLYLRWWQPLEPGRNRSEGMGPFLGDHLDGLGNRVTCFAVANPAPGESGGKLTTRAAGFGVLRLDKKDRTITMECWPRNVKVGSPEARQYPGWPRTIEQTDNDGRAAVACLPTLEIVGDPDPVIEIVDESTGDWVYALRIRGRSFRPKVFRKGSYTIHVGEGPQRRTLRGVRAERLDEKETLRVVLPTPR